MKTSALLIILLFFLGCSNEQQQHEVKIKMYISSETNINDYLSISDSSNYILVKEELENKYKTLKASDIIGFQYEEGYEYVIFVEKTIISDLNMGGVEHASYRLINILSKDKIDYKYYIKTKSNNHFLLPSVGGISEISFVCKKKKYKNGIFIEEEYASLKNLRYSETTNYGKSIDVIKNGDRVGFYKFVINRSRSYNMKGIPKWSFSFYAKETNVNSAKNLSPICICFFDQPQTRGEEYLIIPKMKYLTGTFYI